MSFFFFLTLVCLSRTNLYFFPLLYIISSLFFSFNPFGICAGGTIASTGTHYPEYGVPPPFFLPIRSLHLL